MYEIYSISDTVKNNILIFIRKKLIFDIYFLKTQPAWLSKWNSVCKQNIFFTSYNVQFTKFLPQTSVKQLWNLFSIESCFLGFLDSTIIKFVYPLFSRSSIKWKVKNETDPLWLWVLLNILKWTLFHILFFLINNM